MSLEVREATEEEIEWLKSQLDPPGFYLEKFMALKKKYGAIPVDSAGVAGKLKGSLSKAISNNGMKVRVYKQDNIVFLVRDDFEQKEAKNG